VAAGRAGRSDRARWLGELAMHWYRQAGQEDIAQRVRRRLHEVAGPAAVPPA